jgi:hypothetical protein
MAIFLAIYEPKRVKVNLSDRTNVADYRLLECYELEQV